MQQPVLETERLILRPFRMDDAPAVQMLAGDRAIADTTLHIPHPYPDGAAGAWIASHQPARDSGAGITYAITRKPNGELVGAIGFSMTGGYLCGELGYWVAVAHWNRGYCTEAARAMLAFGFGALALRRVQAHHLARNPASGRVMQKLGMRLERVQRDAVRKWDRSEDIVLYAILAAEWEPGAHRYDASTGQPRT